MENMTYAEALRASMREALAEDENVFLIGEDIGKYGGCYGVTAGLVEEFGLINDGVCYTRYPQ